MIKAILLLLPCLAGATEDLSTEDARALLDHSPWSSVVRSTFQRYPPRVRTPKKSKDPGDFSPPPPLQIGHPAAVAVTWESALPIRLARAKLNQDSIPESYTISLAGLPTILLSNPLFSEKAVAQQATLTTRSKRKSKASSATIVRYPDSVTVLLRFPTDPLISENDQEVELRSFIFTTEIKVKFVLSAMVYQGKFSL